MRALAARVIEAQRASTWRPREGKLLPRPARVIFQSPHELAHALQSVNDESHLLHAISQQSSKSVLALARALAHFQAGEHLMAAHDARIAASSVQKHEWADAYRVRARVLINARGTCDRVAIFPQLQQSANDLLGSPVHAAAVSARVAFEIFPFDARNEAVLKAIAARLGVKERAALMEGGWRGFQRMLLDTMHAEPLIRRLLPPFFFYFRWMEQRMLEHFDALPEPVVDKMLQMDSSDLDLLLQYPKAACIQAETLLEQYEASGAQALEYLEIPPLSWEEVKALKGPGTLSLEQGYDAPGEGWTMESSASKDRSLVASAGTRGELTSTECDESATSVSLKKQPDHARDGEHRKRAIERFVRSELSDESASEGRPGSSTREARMLAAAREKQAQECSESGIELCKYS